MLKYFLKMIDNLRPKFINLYRYRDTKSGS